MAHRDDSVQAVVIGLGIVAAVILLALWAFSRWLGADFVTTTTTVGYSVLGVVLAIGARWVWGWADGRDYSDWNAHLAVLLGLLAWIWWMSWPVLRSIAAGGRPPDEELAFAPWQVDAWYTVGGFRWGVLLLFMLSGLWFIWRWIRDRS